LEKIAMKATVRKTRGNGPAKVLRREGYVPAVLYGPDAEAILLSVNTRDFENLIKHRNINQLLLNLTIGNGQPVTKAVMIKELQTHPVSQNILHIDFYEIDMKRKIRINVPVVTTGKSIGVESGGVVQIVRRDLEVFCMPTEIPEAIEIDISELNMGQSVHVQEIPLEDNIEIAADVNFTVVTILSPKVDIALDEEEAAAEEAAAAAEEDAEEGAEETAAEDDEQ